MDSVSFILAYYEILTIYVKTWQQLVLTGFQVLGIKQFDFKISIDNDAVYKAYIFFYSRRTTKLA